MTIAMPCAEPGHRLVPRLFLSLIAALALVFGPLSLVPADAATGYTVSGTVTAEDVGALMGADVRLEVLTSDDDFRVDDYAVTDEDGYYEFLGVEPDTYRIVVEGTDGLVTQYGTPFDLTGDTTIDEIALVRGGSISGTVTDTLTEAAVEGATVEAYPWDGTSIDYSFDYRAAVDELGTFTLPGLAPGDYKVEIRDDFGSHVSEFYDNVSDAAAAELVSVEKDVDEPIGAIALDEGAVISGQLQDDDGELVLNPAVAALRIVDGVADYENAYRADVDELGHYTIARLPAGAYKIEFAADNYLYFPEFYNDVPSLAEADEIDVELGEVVELETTSLEKVATVTGAVEDESGTLLEDIGVDAYPVVDGVVADETVDFAYTDDEGQFTIAPLHAGTYELHYFDGEHVYADAIGNDRVTVEGGQTLDVGTMVLAEEVVVHPPAPPAVVKVAPSIKVTATGAKKKATLTVTVKAAGVTPTGTITVKLGSKRLKTVSLKGGKAKIAITKQKKGKKAFTIIYSGDSQVLGKTVKSKKVKIK